MRCVSGVLWLLAALRAAAGAVNYCGARMCGHTQAHTYCRYPPGPSPSCSRYLSAPLSVEERVRVLARLNRRRSELARGWRHWPPAGNMMKLRWIEELSREAQRWADQCRPPNAPEERDACRDLYSISVGQCVASIVGEAPGLRPESMVDMWFMQSMLYEGNVTSYVPASDKNYYGDFAQMMWSRTYLVGCGRSKFMAEWQGRWRSVERLVCNFAPRGPVSGRPLWSPAEPASMCPVRSRPDTLPGLCDYHNDAIEARNFNNSWSVEDNYLLDTVFEIEHNKTLDYLGSLDELYLTKLAIATIGTTIPVLPLYYSLHKRDIFEQTDKYKEVWNIDNKSEIADNSVLTDEATTSIQNLYTIARTTNYTKTKVNTIGRPKPYDMSDLNDAVWEKKMENQNEIQGETRSKEKDVYVEYGLEVTEDDVVNSTITTAILSEPIINDTKSTVITKVNLENIGRTEKMTTTEGMADSKKYHTNLTDELNLILNSNKSVDYYLSDPETVRALQDALEHMEQTLASPRPTSSSGKVRRELRNVADLHVTSSAREVVTSEATFTPAEEQTTTKDRGPMLSMVLKYMPYLKQYEDTISGSTRSGSDRLYHARCVLAGSFFLHVLL